MTDKLEPCPFCGKTSPLVLNGIGEPDWWVQCQTETCFCEGPASKTEKGAVRAWNRRTEPSPTRADLAEALRCALLKRELGDTRPYYSREDTISMLRRYDEEASND